MPEPLSRCYRCGARHAEHRRSEAGYVCIGVSGYFADDPSVVGAAQALQPCPFCGGAASIVGTKKQMWALCDTAPCLAKGPARRSPELAARAWNDRPEPPAENNASVLSEAKASVATRDEPNPSLPNTPNPPANALRQGEEGT